jgi:transcriptional regulator NrdR family protein
LECLNCGGRMRSPGVDGKDDAFAICRWRKCNNCNAGFETREVFASIIEQTIAGPIRLTKADRCPVCNAKSTVRQTIPTGPGAVVRVRICKRCQTRFDTQEAVCRTMVEYEVKKRAVQYE